MVLFLYNYTFGREDTKNLMQYKFSKELYSKEALIKAAYNYIDDFYVHLDSDGEYFIVDVNSREHSEKCINEQEFINEMLIQETRRIVNDRTMNIREIMYSRAMASTVIDENNQESSGESENAEKILVDWFEENE